MVTDKIKQLKATQDRVAELERAIAADLARELSGLPAKYGFDSVQAFIKAVKGSGGGGTGRRRGRPPGKGKRRRRAVITSEMKSQVKSLAQSGKTGAEIARAVGISLPSVQNIKKEMGLVKARRK
jgi:hypothetical protein